MSRKTTRRLLVAGALAALLAVFPWVSLPDLGQKIAQQFAPQGPVEDAVQVTEVAGLPTSGAVVAVDDVSVDPNLQPAVLEAAGYATTQPLETEISPPVLLQPSVTLALMPADEASEASNTPVVLDPMPAFNSPGGPFAGPTQTSGSPVIGAAGPGGFGSPFTSGPPAGGSAPPAGRAPGGNGLAPNSPIASVPNSPASPIASAPGTPVNNDPLPVDLPAQINDPVIVANTEPGDTWFSPGHSPGTATVDGDFTLGGDTLLFEILGTEAGIQYDQLIVTGAATLDTGNVVFAFINDFPQDDISGTIFELILAASVAVDFDEVAFYYGFFDPAVDASYDLHAPYDLSLYNVWDLDSGIAMVDTNGSIEAAGDKSFEAFFGIQYGSNVNTQSPADQRESQPFTPIAIDAAVPAPAPLLLLATGLLAAGSFRRRHRSGR